MSAWFRLFLYENLQSGPSSIFLPMGCRLLRLPSLFWKSRKLIVTQGVHEPVILNCESALLAINESLQIAPVFIQVIFFYFKNLLNSFFDLLCRFIYCDYCT